MQAVSADVLADLFDAVVGSNQLVALSGVDAIVARIQHWRTGDQHMHLSSAAFTQERHQALARRAANDRVVNDCNFLAADLFADRAQLEIDHAFAHRLRWLNERTRRVAGFQNALRKLPPSFRNLAQG